MAGRHTPMNRQPPRQQLIPNHLKPIPAEVIAGHHRELHQLLTDQKQMIAIYTHLKKDLSSLDDQLRHLSVTSRELTLERDAKVNELYDKSVKLEAEVRCIEDLRLEHAQVVDDVEKIRESKIELADKFKDVYGELCRVKEEAKHVCVVQCDVENMRKEILKGRAAVEFEKKTRLTNLELSEAMEKKKSSLQYEIEMLRSELSNAEKRARAAVAAASNPNPGGPEYMGNYGSRSMAYGRNPYSVQYSLHQGQITADVPSPALYVRPGGSHGPLDTQHHVPKG